MKQLRLLLSLCLIFNVFLTDIHGTSSSDYLEGIDQYVISGSGTDDDPFILDRNFEYIDVLDQRAINAIQPSSTRSNDFNGNLNGTAHYYQINGATWRYSSGGYSVTTDNVMRINSITYNNYYDTVQFVALRNSSTNKQRLINCLQQGLVGSALTNTLALAGMEGIMATAMGSIFAISMGISTIANNDLQIASNALNSNHGLLLINYSISYHGSWYSTHCYDIWTTYSVVYNNTTGNIEYNYGVAYEPSPSYGTGVFTSK